MSDESESLPAQVGESVRGLRLSTGTRQSDVADAARRHGLGWSQSSVATLEAGQRDLTAAELAPLPSILRDAVGVSVRRVRETAGLRQTDVSQASRAHGLAWSQSRVAALERGDKAVSIEELALLPILLSNASGRDVTLSDLIRPDARIALSATVTVDGRTLVGILGGQPVAVDVRGASRPDWLDDADRHAAKRIGCAPEMVLTVAKRLWGRRLSEERDRLVAERDGNPSPDRRRALRGHAARRLADEIAEAIKREEAH